MTANPHLSFSESLPQSIRDYVTCIAQSGLAEQIILFGSRARGDFRENSDFDFAIKWIDSKDINTLHFLSELNDKPLTLYKVDLLDLDQAAFDYKNEIAKEGKIIWQIKG